MKKLFLFAALILSASISRAQTPITGLNIVTPLPVDGSLQLQPNVSVKIKEAYTNNSKFAKIVFETYINDSVVCSSPYIGNVSDFNNVPFDFTTAYSMLKTYFESKGLTVEIK